MRLIEANQTQVLIENRSQFTGRYHQMWIHLDQDDFESAIVAWRDGALIQNAFPTLSADEREFLLTGCTPEEWVEIFPDS